MLWIERTPDIVTVLDEFVNLGPWSASVAENTASDDAGDRSEREVGGHYSRGSRAHTPVGESGLTALKEQRMIHEAARRGWLKGTRWATEATPTDLKNRQHVHGELNAKDMAIAVTMTNMSKALEVVNIPGDPTASREINLANGSLGQKAVNSIVQMERQNQTDDLMAQKLQADGENARALSSSVLEGIVSQCTEAVTEVVGSEKAREVHSLLAERMTVEGANRRGTDLTPDQDARDMDATIPGPPEA